MHPSRPSVLFMQKHWDVMRTDDAGENWREVSGNLPTDFGFAIDVHAHEPETIYVVPIKSDSEHFPLDGQLRVYRSRSGGDEWEGSRRACRNAIATSTFCAMRWPSTRSAGAACTSARPAGKSTYRAMQAITGGRSFGPPGSALGRSPDAAVIRVVLPANLKVLAHVSGELRLDVAGVVTQRSVLDALEAGFPMLRGTIRDQATQRRRPFVRFFACERDLYGVADAPLPEAVAAGTEPLLVVGGMAGG